jgi:hypothetical protein
MFSSAAFLNILCIFFTFTELEPDAGVTSLEGVRLPFLPLFGGVASDGLANELLQNNALLFSGTLFSISLSTTPPEEVRGEHGDLIMFCMLELLFNAKGKIFFFNWTLEFGVSSVLEKEETNMSMDF